MAENNIKFIKCTAEQWNSFDKTSTSGHIYFVSGGSVSSKTLPSKLYITNGTASPECYGVNANIIDVTYVDTSLKFTLADGTTKDISIGLDETTQKAIETLKGLLNEEGELNISLQYQSQMDDSLATLTALGGIAAGTTAAELKKKTLSEVFDDLLFPTIQPTKTDNSVSVALKSYSQYVKVGSAAPNKDTNFTFTNNLGAININGSKKQDYAGPVDSSTFKVSTGEWDAFTIVPAGTTTFTYTAHFTEGPEPKNSKGGKATSVTQYTGGDKTATCNIVGRYPVYTNAKNTANAKPSEEITPSASTTLTVEFGSAGVGQHQAFAVHETYSVKTIAFYNSVGKSYDAVDIASQFDITDVTYDINDNAKDCKYKLYTRKDAETGALSQQITINYNGK